jgi:hypothetical protein
MHIDKPMENVAILALMMAGIVIERLSEIGQLDGKTIRHLRHLVISVRKHAQLQAGHELDELFSRIELKLGPELSGTPAA